MIDGALDGLATLTGDAAPPRLNGELVFQEPWEGRAMAIAVATVDRLGLDWDDFRHGLMGAIADDPERPYYESWVTALERMLVERGLTSTAALDAAEPLVRPDPSSS